MKAFTRSWGHVHEHVPGAVYVGRPTIWGNPYVIGKDGDRAEVIRKYEARLRANKRLMSQVRAELKDRFLTCWCYPDACHAEVLVRVANEEK